MPTFSVNEEVLYGDRILMTVYAISESRLIVYSQTHASSGEGYSWEELINSLSHTYHTICTPPTIRLYHRCGFYSLPSGVFQKVVQFDQPFKQKARYKGMPMEYV